MNIQISLQLIESILKAVFPTKPDRLEHVPEGASTYVYRIIFPRETFYLRILPEENASFAPEVLVHRQLRQMQVKVPEVLHFEHCNELLQRSIMITTEIKGKPISQSTFLSHAEIESITVEAGIDLARVNSLLVEGFSWIKRDQATLTSLTYALSVCSSMCEHWLDRYKSGQRIDIQNINLWYYGKI